MPLSTRRLYRDDPYQTGFEAHVLQRLECAGQPAVLLDATCFYPTSGGQPHDTGRLNDVVVIDVQERGEQIVHVLAEPLEADQVHGEIYWARRFDHMQQHTGQHLLSQAFVRELAAATLAFHLGEEASTIDVELPAFDWETLARVEEAANRAVLANLPVTVCECQPSELASAGLRKAPQVEGMLRVVRIGDYDASACCGTHVRATGEIGPIQIRRWERSKGHTRVEFLCGWRALRSQRAQNRLCQELAGRLTVAVGDLPQAVERLTADEGAARKGAQALRKRLLACELPTLAEQAEVRGNLRVLYRLLDGYEAADMRTVAQRFTQQPDRIALLAVLEPTPQLCFARSANVAIDMAALLRRVVAPYGGRGGGTAQLAQGGGVIAEELTNILAAASAEVAAASAELDHTNGR